MPQHILQTLIEDLEAQQAPDKTVYHTPHTQFTIEIDKDHTATLTLDDESLHALNNLKIELEDPLSDKEKSELFFVTFKNTEFDFGTAIEAMKKGFKVSRKGWNGKNMYLAIQEGSTITPDKARSGAAKALAEEGKEEIKILPHIDMRSAQGDVVVGWLASQTDMLAEDWILVG